MENNEFNISSDNNFKNFTNNKKSFSFTKGVLVPFVSGVLGASLVIGSCIYVPSLNNFLGEKLKTTETKPVISTNAGASISGTNLINLTEYSETSVAVAAKVLPSIVGITVEYSVNSFFGNSSTAQASGSGIIISEDGYIMTNNHIIDSKSNSSFYSVTDASKITVYLYDDETPYEAEIIGNDSITDLAVIKIKKNGLTPATLGNSDNVVVGEFAMAIGNPLGMQSSITCGVISGINREVTDSEGTTYKVIQTDAAINSGNSGGALVNSRGEVIGINTLKLSGTGIEGMGFAIPMNSTTEIINQLIEYKKVKRPYIGINGSAITEQGSKAYNLPIGIYVQEVIAGSPAEAAGIKKSDVITQINDTKVSTVSELTAVKNELKIGDTVTLKLVRSGEEMTVELVLGEEK